MPCIYILDNETGGKVEKTCITRGLTIFGVRNHKHKQDSDPKILETVDLYILGITRPAWDAHLILAKAILLEKPTLCLYKKNFPPKEILSFIHLKGKPAFIMTFSYTSETLEYAVNKFLDLYDPAMVYENQARIKFTLRLTERNDRYLIWLAEQQGMSKADCLRQLLEKLENQDERYAS